MIYFSYFQLISEGLVHYGREGMVEHSCSGYGNQEVQQRQEGARQGMPFKDMVSLTFLQPGPTFQSFRHLLTVYSNLNPSMN
jgi:hypothetical protein